MNEQDLERELQTAKATIQTLYGVFHNVYPRLAEALKGESRYLARVVDTAREATECDISRVCSLHD